MVKEFLSLQKPRQSQVMNIKTSPILEIICDNGDILQKRISAVLQNVTEMIGEIDFMFVFGCIWKHFQGSIDNFQNFILLEATLACPNFTPPF